MKEEFTNSSGGKTLIFTDTHLQYIVAPKMKHIPYDKISKIKYGFLGLTAEGNDTYINIQLENKDKTRVKELVSYVEKNPQYFYNNPNFCEKFNSQFGGIVIFNNIGITVYHDLPEESIISYENIKKIAINVGTFIVEKADKTNIIFVFSKEDKERANRVLKEVNSILDSVEHRIRCNICGHIFCYTNQDIKENKRNEASANLHTFTSAINALGGTAYNMYEERKRADAANAKIIDFSKCPKCNSSNITAITEEEWKNINNKSKTETNNNLSIADEIKKFKELLDSGVITQEEFDAKKKELLGL